MLNEPGKTGLRECLSVLAKAALLLSLTLPTGCSAISPLQNFGLGRATPQETRIMELMDWHSGRTEVYRDFRTVFTARAVYLSDEIQELAADWEARSKLMSPEERADFEKKFLSRENAPVKVLLGFYTPDEVQNNLSSDNSTWIAYVKGPDGSVSRASCLDVNEENTRIYMRFLKWDLSWSKLYLLCFPALPDPGSLDNGRLSLVISGPGGTGEIDLKVEAPAK